MNNSSTSLFASVLARIILYGLFLAGISQVLFLDALVTGVEQTFVENSWTEYSQVVLLFGMVTIFLVAGKITSEYRSLSLLLALVPTLAFIREFDGFLDEKVFDGAWQTIAFLALVILTFLIYRTRNDLRRASVDYFSHFSFGLYLSGFLTTLVFSRLYGRGTFWKALMEEDYIRAVKNASEESIELLGYSLLFISAIEFIFFSRKKENSGGSIIH